MALPFLLLLLFPYSFQLDVIKNLPGLNFEINFRHYSGFFNVSTTHRLHYWFVESARDSSRDPLMFWFNGGPGCSSLDGLLNEMGPYVVNPDGETLSRNPFAWNRFASIVYIESPIGVGYSYSTDNNITTDDDQTSLENYKAVKAFFTEFPQFRNHSTFIFAESYGGVYAPTLATRIIDSQHEFPINLKGVALGNGYVNADLNVDTSVQFAYAHGFVDEKTWNYLKNNCCSGCMDCCNLTKLLGHCTELVNEIMSFIWNGGLNPYDIYRSCDANSEQNGPRVTALRLGIVPNVPFPKSSLKKEQLAALKKWSPSYGDAPCLNDTAVTKYMNDPKVREALNIPEGLTQWQICASVPYTQQYRDMKPFVKKIVDKGIRMLLYYGDTDLACNFLLGQQFSSNLGLKRKQPKKPWKFQKQIAGFQTKYEGLSFITIRGAGHMAPQWRAPQMAYVAEQFLSDQPI